MTGVRTAKLKPSVISKHFGGNQINFLAHSGLLFWFVCEEFEGENDCWVHLLTLFLLHYKWINSFGYKWSEWHYSRYLAGQRASWRLWLSQTVPGWWVVRRSGSLSKWPPWSAGRLPGSPAPACGGSSRSSALTNHSCSAPAARQAAADLKAEGNTSAAVTTYSIGICNLHHWHFDEVVMIKGYLLKGHHQLWISKYSYFKWGERFHI